MIHANVFRLVGRHRRRRHRSGASRGGGRRAAAGWTLRRSVAGRRGRRVTDGVASNEMEQTLKSNFLLLYLIHMFLSQRKKQETAHFSKLPMGFKINCGGMVT